MYPLTGDICIKMQEKRIHKCHTDIKDDIILEVFKSNHMQAYEKEYWILMLRIIFQQTKPLQEKMGNFISEETVGRFLQNTDLRWTHF